MAVDWRAKEVCVVGFCGLPVAAAAAMASPLFESPPGRFFAGDPDSPVPPRMIFDRDQLEEQRADARITLTSQRWARKPAGVVLYADRAFLAPGREMFRLEALPLVLDPTAHVHVWYGARAEALQVLRSWGDSLIADATRSLRSRPSAADIERAIDAAQRALFCAPPPEHAELRFEAFVVLLAGHQMLRRPVDRLYQEARLDFDDIAIARLRSRVEAKAAGAFTYAPIRARSRVDPADGKRIPLTIRRTSDVR